MTSLIRVEDMIIWRLGRHGEYGKPCRFGNHERLITLQAI